MDRTHRSPYRNSIIIMIIGALAWAATVALDLTVGLGEYVLTGGFFGGLFAMLLGASLALDLAD